MRDGSRNVGEVYASDIWALTPQWTIAAGGRYADYAYLDDSTLLSGRVTFEVQPSLDRPFRLSLSAAHREIAPGAEEFVPPATGVWLPPERTFSDLSRGLLQAERIDHVEIGGEHDVQGGLVVAVRAFREVIGDQLVTVFAVPDSPATLGHYFVATGGDFENYGWGAGVRRSAGTVQLSVDYTQIDTHRRGESTHAELLLVAPALVRGQERIHDLTATLRTRVPVSATRLLVVYKLNNAFADDAEAATAARFEVQVNQEIPFLDFTGARWEMLAAVRNLFRSDLFDGSVYDELLVVRPPKRVMGGLTVRF
jgi:outer membrane receptor protein involved in Fe transport